MLLGLFIRVVALIPSEIFHVESRINARINWQVNDISIRAFEERSDSSISSTFNVGDLTLYQGHDTDEESGEYLIALPFALYPIDKIVDVLDSQILSTR